MYLKIFLILLQLISFGLWLDLLGGTGGSVMGQVQTTYYRSRVRRPECRDKGPRRQEELPGIVASGTLDEIYAIDVERNETVLRGRATIFRVIHGPADITGNSIEVRGLNDPDLCDVHPHAGEAFIFLLDELYPGVWRLNRSLLRITLENLDRMNAIVRDEPFRRRAPIVELPCEKKYCENNAECREEIRAGERTERAKCGHCDLIAATCRNHSSPNSLISRLIPTISSPVCASSGETFPTECALRAESCRREENLFVAHLGECTTDNGSSPPRRPAISPPRPSTSLSSYSSSSSFSSSSTSG